jgi:predicted TIM-barrel fold metal-dependent hydrolase
MREIGISHLRHSYSRWRGASQRPFLHARPTAAEYGPSWRGPVAGHSLFPVVDDYRSQHDLIGQGVRAHRDRLAGAVCLYPLLDRSSFCDEVHRCRGQYGFRALQLQPQYHGLNPMSASSDFFFESALANQLAVVRHTGAVLPPSSPALLMVLARKFPDLMIVIAHSGGAIFVNEAIVAALFCPNILLELATLMPHHVLAVLGQVASDRLMIGSDLPESVEMEIGKIISLDVPDLDKRNILNETGCRVFGAGAEGEKGVRVG